jgi:hypothetical protein
MDKNFYDDNCFYIQKKRWGTYQSYYPDGKGIITALTEEEVLKSTRWYLKKLQEGFDETKTYSTKDNYKL